MYARLQEHMGKNVHAQEIIEACADKISTCAEEDWFHIFLTSSVATQHQISE